jgi:hypothetical protein
LKKSCAGSSGRNCTRPNKGDVELTLTQMGVCATLDTSIHCGASIHARPTVILIEQITRLDDYFSQEFKILRALSSLASDI